MEKRSDSLTVLKIDADVRAAFSKVKEEFEEHLAAINESTDEINAAHGRLGEVEEKIDKLNARLDTIHLMFQQLIVQTRVSVELSPQEQRAFAILSTQPYIGIADLASRAYIDAAEAEDVLTSLADKGIPVTRKMKDGETYLKLDDDFRKLQEQHRIVKVDPAIMQRVENKQLMNFFG